MQKLKKEHLHKAETLRSGASAVESPPGSEDGRRERENMDYAKEIKKSLERLEYYENLANEKYNAWDADPLNPDRQEAVGWAYVLEFNEFIHAAHLISKFAGVDEKTARTMIRTKRAELMRILTA